MTGDVDRVEGRVGAEETLIGLVPRRKDFDTVGLDVSAQDVDAAMRVDAHEWKQELEQQGEWFDKVGARMPRTLKLHRELLLERVKQWTGHPA